jgi:hypothetical protein
MSSMIVPPCPEAISHIVRKSSSVPKALSISVLIRSKWPSTLGVGCHPVSPPARLTGPVCRALMPIRSKLRHRSGSARVPRKELPGLVISESGYAVNQTPAARIADSGFGLA